MSIKIVNLFEDNFVDFQITDRSYLSNSMNCVDYHEWFYTNLNPDLAPPGFLEELDRILQAASSQNITIGYVDESKRCQCETIKEYIDGQIRN